jgi:hypothetical protein
MQAVRTSREQMRRFQAEGRKGGEAAEHAGEQEQA